MPMRWQHVGSLDSRQVGWPMRSELYFLVGKPRLRSSLQETQASCPVVWSFVLRARRTPQASRTRRANSGMMESTWSESYMKPCEPLWPGEVVWHHLERPPKFIQILQQGYWHVVSLGFSQVSYSWAVRTPTNVGSVHLDSLAPGM